MACVAVTCSLYVLYYKQRLTKATPEVSLLPSNAGQDYNSLYLLLASKIEDLETKNVLQLELIVVHCKQRFLSNEWCSR